MSAVSTFHAFDVFMSTHHAFDVFMIANGGWLAPSVIVFIINDHIFARIRWPLPYAMQRAKIVMTGLVVFAVVAVFLAMLVDSRFIEYHHIVIFASMYSAFL